MNLYLHPPEVRSDTVNRIIVLSIYLCAIGEAGLQCADIAERVVLAASIALLLRNRDMAEKGEVSALTKGLGKLFQRPVMAYVSSSI